MTNENQQMNNTSEQKTAPFGARLKSAREALGLERKDAAAQLRLNENLIVMMEKDKYPDDLPITFIRGYIRAYGKLLQIPELEIRQAIEPIGPKPSVILPLPSIKPNLFEPVTSSNYFMQFFTYLIGITIVGLVGIWWYTRAPAPTQPLNPITIEKPVQPVVTSPAPVINQQTAPSPTDNLPQTMAVPAPQSNNDLQAGQIPPSAGNHASENEPAAPNQPVIPQNPEPVATAPAPSHPEQSAQLYATPATNPGPQQLNNAPPANQAAQAPVSPQAAQPIQQQNVLPNGQPNPIQQAQPVLPVPLNSADPSTNPQPLSSEQNQAQLNQEQAPAEQPRKHVRTRARAVHPEIEVLEGDEF